MSGRSALGTAIALWLGSSWISLSLARGTPPLAGRPQSGFQKGLMPLKIEVLRWLS